MCRAEGPFLLRDFRTVGIKVPRQCGKSFEAVQRVIRNEKAIMICINDSLRKAISTNVSSEIMGRHPHGEPLKPHQIARMYTVDEVIKAIRSVRNGQQDILLEGANEIIVDDSHWFFQLVRENQFYQWLWERQGADQKILLL